jgi:hypothetical protein
LQADLSFLFDGISDAERDARLRETRMAGLLLFGAKHPLSRAFAAAIADPTVIAAALAEIDVLPALPRRRLLAVVARVLRAVP